MYARFKDSLGSKVVEDLNRLQQVRTLDEYLAKFEELKALLLIRNPTMPNSYFLESFIGGLKPAVKPLVRASNPTTLDVDIEQASLHEKHMLALKIPPEKPYKSSSNFFQTPQKSQPSMPNFLTQTP